MKKSLLLLYMAVLTSITASAYEFMAENVDGKPIYYDINAEDGSAVVTKASELGNDYSGVVIIPSSVTNAGKTYQVKAIGEEAFEYCADLKKVVLPNGITYIGPNAFWEAEGLSSINIPSTVTTIDFNAFSWTNIVSITLPEGLTSLGAGAFSGTSLTDIVIPKNITEISASCFQNCEALTSVTILGDITSIGKSAFEGCNNLLSIELPNSLTNIHESAFSYCTSLSSVKIPRYVTLLDHSAFGGCSGLKEIETRIDNPGAITGSVNAAFWDVDVETCILKIPEGTESLYAGLEPWKDFKNVVAVKNYDFTVTSGGMTYYYIFNLGNKSVSLTYNTKIGSYSGAVTVPSSVTYNGVSYPVTGIDDYAFNGCTGLTSVTLPSVTRIGKHAFDGCTSLSSKVMIPATVTLIDDYAFYNCTSMELGNNRPMPGLKIGKSAFENCKGISGLYLPDGLISIGDRAFYGCTGLKACPIPNTVTSIGVSAFENCTSLKKMILPESLHAIPESLCANCTSLEEVLIPRGAYTIDNYVFKGCTSLAKVVSRLENPPVTKDYDGIQLFKDCPKFVLYIPSGTYNTYNTNGWVIKASSVEILPYYDFVYNDIYYRFTGYDGLQASVVYKDDNYNSYTGAVTVPATATYEGYRYDVTSISNKAFYKCSGLTSVTMPDSIKTIGVEAFAYCTKLDNVVIPDRVRTIFKSAFAYCTGLKSLQMSNGVRLINEEAFYSCTNLDNVTIPATIESIGNKAFYGCSHLSSVTVEKEDPTAISLGTDVFKVVPVSDCILYVPKGCVQKYRDADTQWDAFLTIKEIGGSEVQLGDVNGDGKINGGDITYIIYYMLSKTPADFIEEAADVNGDGKINGGDITYIIYYMLNKITF